jgi:hypothetical protein
VTKNGIIAINLHPSDPVMSTVSGFLLEFIPMKIGARMTFSDVAWRFRNSVNPSWPSFPTEESLPPVGFSPLYLIKDDELL